MDSDEFMDDSTYRRRHGPRLPSRRTPRVTLAGVLTIAAGVLRMIAGIALGIFGARLYFGGRDEKLLAAQAGRPPEGCTDVMMVFGELLALAAFFIILLALANVFAGIGVLRRRRWARVVALVFAAFDGVSGLTGLVGIVPSVANAHGGNGAPELAVAVFVTLPKLAYGIFCFAALLPATAEFDSRSSTDERNQDECRSPQA